MKILGEKPFIINTDTKIIMNSSPNELDSITVLELNNKIYNLVGYQFSVVKSPIQEPFENIIVIGEPLRNPTIKYLLDKNNIKLNKENPGEQGYIIFSNSNLVLISGYDVDGTYYGIQTLLNIINSNRINSVEIPNILIRDYPSMKYRGLFNENKWGPDLMTLNDYKNMIDFMAENKMNMLAIGIYGCWAVQYRNKITEFFMIPVDNYPQLKTPKLIEFYSPKSGGWQKLDYLPTIFEKDLFGQIIKYGKKKHVLIRPKFNSLGHNTLIPRIFPEISAKDEKGNPLYENFCTSNERTYEILFNIYDNIIDKYLKPNGVDWFDIQMDEVYQFCKCEKCRKIKEEEIYLNHVIKLANHLKSKGIKNVGIWTDMLEKRKMINSHFVQTLEKEGLKDILVLQWWDYTEPIQYETLHPEISLRNWVVPMTGYLYPHQFWYNVSRWENVFKMVRLGQKDKAEGADSYSIFDPGYHFNNTALANFSWNPPDSIQGNTLEDFIENYSKKIFGERWKEGNFFYHSLDKFYPEYNRIMNAILYYRYSYVNTKPYKKRPYPEEALETLKKIPDVKNKLIKMAGITGNAKNFLKSVLNSDKVNKEVVIQFYADILRASNIIDVFLLLFDIEEDYQKFKSLIDSDSRLKMMEKIRNNINKIFYLQMESIKTWENVKPEYLHPHNLRDMSFMLKFCEETLKRINEIEDKIKNNSLKEIPDTMIIGTYSEL
jgi:hypothetical protein